MALIPPDKSQMKTVLDNINLTEQQLEKNVQVLRTWLTQQPHLPQNINDTMLVTFIVQCKNSLERAKELIDTFYSHRFTFPEYFEDYNPMLPDLQQSFDVVSHAICRNQTPTGQRVQIVKITDLNASNYDPIVVTKRMFMVGMIRMIEEGIEGGEIIIYDFDNCSFKHLAALGPVQAKKYAASAKMVPMRIKKVIIINAPSALETLISIFKSCVIQKMQKRVYVYSGDYTNLYEHVPKAILPKDYGGNDPTIKELSEYWRERCKEMTDYFLDDKVQRSDESKRIGKSKYKPDQLFGFEGSFKSIAID